MSRRKNAAMRCSACRMHASLCVCALVPRILTRTRVVLLIHRYEHRKPTNTGRLAASCLLSSEVILRGERDDVSLPPAEFDPARALLLFPHEDAAPLVSPAPDIDTLVVPDGTWRQASKVRARVPWLRGVRCATLPLEAPSLYRLRAEAHPTGLATAEAVARAMGILEGNHVRVAIERVFRAMVERVLWCRGELDATEVTGGIPNGAQRHDPRSGLARQRPDGSTSP